MDMEEVLGMVVGMIFVVLGIILLLRFKTLSSHHYFRLLFIVVAIILIGFGIYLGISGFYWNE